MEFPNEAASPRRLQLPAALAEGASLRGFGVAALKVGRILLVIAALYMLVYLRGSLSWTGYALTITVVGCALVAMLGRHPDILLGVGYLAGFAVFSLLRGMTDETPIPVQYDYVIALERALPGPVPTLWLQEHLRSGGEVSLLDRVMTGIHLSYFFVPMIVGLALWRWRHALIARYTVTLLVIYVAGVVMSFLLPTAPPWLAAESGDIAPIAKVTDWVYGDVGAGGPSSDLVRMNAVAAMPSLHMAITVVVALALARFGRVWLAVATSYAVAMGVALAYLGEHYVVDELAGVLLAVAVWWLVLRGAAGPRGGQP